MLSIREFLPITGFHFDRPILLFQSDDWGRVGLRDGEGFEQLRSAGIQLGEKPYDLYTLETAADLADIAAVLMRHPDSAGNPPVLQMNFVVANLDFARMPAGTYEIRVLPLADGLPAGWNRPGLIEGYHSGIAAGVFHPALHGTTHFCRAAVERAGFEKEVERKQILSTLWAAGTPYIHWRMPWIGYEYWDPEQNPSERFLSREVQRDLIGQAVGAFAKLFSCLPKSACAPGYRANDDTHRTWSQHGVRVAQSGPGRVRPPYFGKHGMLHLTRNVEFEPATDPDFSVERCLQQVERCFATGIPAVVSIHSINFHSTVHDFRSPTLLALDSLLTALRSRHPDLLYLHDATLWALIGSGEHEGRSGRTTVKVTRKPFVRALAGRGQA